MMRGRQPSDDLGKSLPSRRNSRCKGPRVGMSFGGQTDGTTARLQHSPSEARIPTPKFDVQSLCSLLLCAPLFRGATPHHQEQICPLSLLSLRGQKVFSV